MIELDRTFLFFISSLLEAIPFLVFGIAVSSTFMVFVGREKLTLLLPKHPFWGAIAGSCLGLVLPVCKYGNIPVARRLLIEGVSLPIAISFLLAAPTLNPLTIWLTWQAFPNQPQMLFLRVMFIWLIAVAIGLIFSRYPQQTAKLTPNKLTANNSLIGSATILLEQPQSQPQPLHRMGKLIYQGTPSQVNSQPKKFSLWLQNTMKELQEFGLILVVGTAIAAILRELVPQIAILNWGQSYPTQILALIFLSLILSLGSIGNVFFVSSLAAIFSDGALLALLLFGSIIDFKTLGLMLFSFSPRILLAILILVTQLVFFFSVCLDFYFI